jgi:hypothetical protein
MNLLAAAVITGTIYIFINWFCIPRKKKGKVVKMDDDRDLTENFY